jgi:glycosyltransferase involved in cell wall biosynthesis
VAARRAAPGAAADADAREGPGVKVLHLVKTVDGASWALRQVRELVRCGVDVVVALPSATAGLAPRYAAAGAEVLAADLDFSPNQPWRLVAAMRRCRALVRSVRPDVIHSHFVSTTLTARLALGRRHPVPRLFQVPGPLHLERAAFRHLELGSAGSADYWIASCRWTQAEYLRRGVRAERVFLSYYGTDLEPFRRARPGALRSWWGPSFRAPLIGMVAYMYAPRRLLRQQRGLKGHEDFIEALRRIGGMRPAARGVIVGGPWVGADAYEQSLRALARSRCGGGITFTGVRLDVPAIYADLDVAVHPSLSENCGGAVESLAAACPTVATSVGGLPDVVIHGETGWLVPPADPGRLAAAIVEVLDNPAEARRRARNGQELVGRLFAVERTAREVADIYERVLGAGGSATEGVRRCTTG